MQKVYRTSDREIEWGYARQVAIVADDRSTLRLLLGSGEDLWRKGGRVTNQLLGKQRARRSALNAQAVLRKQRAGQEHLLEGVAGKWLTALDQRDGAVRDAERCDGSALLAMTPRRGLVRARSPSSWVSQRRLGGIILLCGRGIDIERFPKTWPIPANGIRGDA
jgi:hypothetical protein